VGVLKIDTATGKPTEREEKIFKIPVKNTDE